MNSNSAYSEEFREELINGKLVAMSPRPAYNHNRVASNIFVLFDRFLKGRKCVAIADGMDLYLSDKDWFVPDMMVVCDSKKLQADGVHGAPDLVAEVLSPSTMRNDRIYKKRIYGESGVREYWIADPRGKYIETYRNEGGELVLYEIYPLYEEYMLKKMSGEERAAVAKTFKCSLFEELEIPLDEIFRDML